MSNTNSSNSAVPENKSALCISKYESQRVRCTATDGYNGNLTSKQNGSVGGLYS